MRTPIRQTQLCARVALGCLAMVAVCAHADTESTPLGPVPETLPIGTPAGASGADPFAFGSYLQTVLALAFVLGLAVLGAAVLKRVARTRGGLVGGMGPGGPSPSGVLEILGRYPLGGGQTLVLLRFDRRVVLLHQSGGRKNPMMRTISEVTDADEVASIMLKTRAPADEAAQNSFREAIHKMERGYEPIGSQEAPGTGQDQIDMLVGENDGTGDVRAIRGALRSWVGASA